MSRKTLVILNLIILSLVLILGLVATIKIIDLRRGPIPPGQPMTKEEQLIQEVRQLKNAIKDAQENQINYSPPLQPGDIFFKNLGKALRN